MVQPNEEAAKLTQMGKADATHSGRWKHMVTNQFEVYKDSCSVNLNVRITTDRRRVEEPLLPPRGRLNERKRVCGSTSGWLVD